VTFISAGVNIISKEKGKQSFDKEVI